MPRSTFIKKILYSVIILVDGSSSLSEDASFLVSLFQFAGGGGGGVVLSVYCKSYFLNTNKWIERKTNKEIVYILLHDHSHIFHLLQQLRMEVSRFLF